MKFDNSFSTLNPILFTETPITPLEKPELLGLSQDALHLLGLKELTPEIQQWLNGEIRLPGDQSISTRYAGHQFGQWAGQLGDGRAISLGEVINAQNERWEVQLKGSGLTEFSRMGDGKAVVRSSIREFLCSEHMHALGVPTTRSLAVFKGQGLVRRETMENEAIAVRLSPSFVRFGHFELCYAMKRADLLTELCDYLLKYFYQDQKTPLEMFDEIVKRTAVLMSKWQAVGFSHGVMNTDNMSILGITLDYGPFGFLDDFNMHFICNHSDHQGRYAFINQPKVAWWNLEKLANALSPIIPQEELSESLKKYPALFEKAFYQEMNLKLGISGEAEITEKIVTDFLTLMHQDRLDYTYTLRRLCDYTPEMNKEFSAKWNEWLVLFSQHRTETKDLKKFNPKYVLKNYIAQEMIENPSLIEAGLKVMQNPFDEHPDFERWSLPTPMDLKDFEISCSS